MSDEKLVDLDSVLRRQLVEFDQEEGDEARGARDNIAELVVAGDVDDVALVGHVERPFHDALEDVQQAGAVLRVAVLAQADDQFDRCTAHFHLVLRVQVLEHGQHYHLQQLLVVQTSLRRHQRSQHLQHFEARSNPLLFYVESVPATSSTTLNNISEYQLEHPR